MISFLCVPVTSLCAIATSNVRTVKSTSYAINIPNAWNRTTATQHRLACLSQENQMDLTANSFSDEIALA